jgi:hypothetical protein
MYSCCYEGPILIFSVLITEGVRHTSSVCGASGLLERPPFFSRCTQKKVYTCVAMKEPGVKGFEPLNVGSKFRCLTPWRHPIFFFKKLFFWLENQTHETIYFAPISIYMANAYTE